MESASGSVSLSVSGEGPQETISVSLADTDFGVFVCGFDANSGQLYCYDKTADYAERHVEIIPLYAFSNPCGDHSALCSQ